MFVTEKGFAPANIYLPAAHAPVEQDVAPVTEVTPAAHTPQDVLPADAEYMPTAQLEQALAPANEYFPPGHVVADAELEGQ